MRRVEAKDCERGKIDVVYEKKKIVGASANRNAEWNEITFHKKEQAGVKRKQRHRKDWLKMCNILIVNNRLPIELESEFKKFRETNVNETQIIFRATAETKMKTS